MREIKFRANIKGTKEIYNVDSIHLEDEYVVLIIGEFNEGNTITKKLSEINLLQYSGLEDKNDKEIYAGDIVYLSGYGDYQVEFPFIELYEAYPEGDIGEIKGNIYENPELLNDK